MPSEEYAKFLKMKEEWEANKPALNEELQKIYENKLTEIEEKINKCLSNSSLTKKITCEIETMCPLYGSTLSCTHDYTCEDGANCWDDTDNTIRCTDEKGKSVVYTEEEFKSKYYGKRY